MTIQGVNDERTIAELGLSPSAACGARSTADAVNISTGQAPEGDWFCCRPLHEGRHVAVWNMGYGAEWARLAGPRPYTVEDVVAWPRSGRDWCVEHDSPVTGGSLLPGAPRICDRCVDEAHGLAVCNVIDRTQSGRDDAIALLRAAGCTDPSPLLGERPGVGPRCRLCNTVAPWPSTQSAKEAQA